MLTDRNKYLVAKKTSEGYVYWTGKDWNSNRAFGKKYSCNVAMKHCDKIVDAFMSEVGV